MQRADISLPLPVKKKRGSAFDAGTYKRAPPLSKWKIKVERVHIKLAINPAWKWDVAAGAKLPARLKLNKL